MKEWQDKIRRVTPYVPGEQPRDIGMIKLNTNENPYPPGPAIRTAGKEFDVDLLRLYPDPTIKGLVDVLADYHHLGKDEVFVGVGSDDVLATAFMTFFASDTPVLFPDITYSFYDVWAELFRIPYKTIPLDENFRICPKDYDIPCGGLVIANPNAPTGVYENVEFIEEMVISHSDCIVIVDEAYVDFAPDTALRLIHKYDNLVIVRTFSKSRSMAGMRIGYAMAQPELIKAMNDVKYSYNSYTLNSTSIEYGKASVLQEEYFRENIAKIVNTRENAKKRFAELGFRFPDSQTNFLFVTHPDKSAAEIMNELRERHIYVRRFPNNPRISEYLRITMGTDEEMEIVYKALKEILGK